MTDIEIEARNLATRHYEIEDGITDIFAIKEALEANRSGNGDTIRLLEVNQNTIPYGVMPIPFAPAPDSGIHFPSVIVEVTPEEFEKIMNKEIPLPPDWEIGDRIPKRDEVNRYVGLR
jgi:hypothetical protein